MNMTTNARLCELEGYVKELEETINELFKLYSILTDRTSKLLEGRLDLCNNCGHEHGAKLPQD